MMDGRFLSSYRICLDISDLRSATYNQKMAIRKITRHVVRTVSSAMALVVLGSGMARGQSEGERLGALLDPLIAQGMRDDPTPGIAVGVVHNGRLVYAKGFGVATLGRPDKPVTTQTLFHMASVTKPFVATCVMQLWEQGKVDLDAPVIKYVPYFHLSDPRYRQITVREMLTHSSGMPDVADYEWNKPQYDDGALERYVKSLGPQKLLWDPGARMQYSNMAYEVLGDLVAKVSGMPWEEYADAHIFKPLSMTSSTLLLKKADPAKITEGYTRPRDGGYDSIHAIVAYPYNRMHSPSSNLHSNVDDMARWAMANLNHGELEGKRILKASTYDLMWKPAVEVEFCRGGDPATCRKPGNQIGISWFLEMKEGHQVVSHGGGDDGFITGIILIPDLNLGFVFMQNSEHPGMTLARTVQRAVLDFYLQKN
jgi:CubicO group peptidase (beta-lactamase class C family)